MWSLSRPRGFSGRRLMNPQDSGGPAQVPGVPRAWLRALALALMLPPNEWRIILLILGWPRPVSVWWIAKRLHLKYSHAKRGVRSLIARKIVQRSSEGLIFQPDFRLWEDPGIG